MGRTPRPGAAPDGFVCPICGSPVTAGRLSCRQCGASDADGWDLDQQSEGWAEEDDDFDYESYVEQEFGGSRDRSSPTYGTGRLSFRAGVLWLLVAAFSLGLIAPLLFWLL